LSTHEHDDIFEAAIRVLLEEDRCVTISFSPGGISLRFPTTRKLAEYLSIPHYYILPRFGAMERDGLIHRAERVGISTTAAGTERLLAIMGEHYRACAERVLGTEVFRALQARADAPGGGRPER
jgi:Mn-dependent DtxR family transcriptional regulator